MRRHLSPLCAALLAACYQPDISADYLGPEQALDTPDGGSEPRDASTTADAGHDAGQDAGHDAGAATPRSLHLSVLTDRVGGRYAPKNIGAIWIERADGTFVRSLQRWAGIRLRYLSRYQTARAASDDADAVSGATLTEHTTHEATWDLRDTSGAMVPVGDYMVHLEITDRDAFGAELTVPFSLGEAPLTLTPDGTAQFKNLSIVIE